MKSNFIETKQRWKSHTPEHFADWSAIIILLVVIIYGVIYSICFFPSIGRHGAIISLCIVIGAPAGGLAIFHSLWLLREKILSRLSYSIFPPKVLTGISLKLELDKFSRVLFAGVTGLLLANKRNKAAMKRAVHNEYEFALDLYDEFEKRLGQNDFTGAFECMQHFCKPNIFPFARKIVFEVYGGALRNELVLSDVANWFKARSAASELGMAVVCFILEDYRSCIRRFRRIATVSCPDATTRTECVRIIDLVLSAAAGNDAGWEEIRRDFLEELEQTTK